MTRTLEGEVSATARDYRLFVEVVLYCIELLKDG